MKNYDTSKSDPTSVLWGGEIRDEQQETADDYEQESEIVDSMGEPIDDEDGVFELTFIHNGYCEQTGVFESGEKYLIVTQINLVDVIQKYDPEYLKKIEYMGLGKQYKESVK